MIVTPGQPLQPYLDAVTTDDKGRIAFFVERVIRGNVTRLALGLAAVHDLEQGARL